MLEQTHENIDKLAQRITDNADIESIIEYFYIDQYEWLENLSKEEFIQRWEDAFDIIVEENKEENFK